MAKMDPGELQALFEATQALIRVKRQLMHVSAEVEEVSKTVLTISIRLQGSELDYGKENDES